MIQVESLSFSGDGKMLAVGSTPGHGDVWDIEKRTKLFSLDGGITVALSPDGRLLAKDENGIEICDAAMGKPIKRIPWSIATSTPGGQFSRDGTVFVGGGGKRLIAWSTNGVWDTSGKQYCHKEGLGTRLPSE